MCVCVFACIIFVAPSLVSQLLFPYVRVWACSPFAWIQRLESASHPHLLTVVRSALSENANFSSIRETTDFTRMSPFPYAYQFALYECGALIHLGHELPLQKSKKQNTKNVHVSVFAFLMTKIASKSLNKKFFYFSLKVAVR